MYYHRAERISNHSSPILLPVFLTHLLYTSFSLLYRITSLTVGALAFLFRLLRRAGSFLSSIIGAYSLRERSSSSLWAARMVLVRVLSAHIRHASGSLPAFCAARAVLFRVYRRSSAALAVLFRLLRSSHARRFSAHQQNAACSEAVQKAIKKPSGGRISLRSNQ